MLQWTASKTSTWAKGSSRTVYQEPFESLQPPEENVHEGSRFLERIYSSSSRKLSTATGGNDGGNENLIEPLSLPWFVAACSHEALKMQIDSNEKLWILLALF